MSYPAREIKTNAYYKIFSRCINLSNILNDESIKLILLKTIADCQNKYSFQLISYNIRSNDINIIIKTNNDEDNISVIMKYIKGVFAKRYNIFNKRTGPVWNERFHSEIIDSSKSKLINYFINYINNFSDNKLSQKDLYCSFNNYQYQNYKNIFQIKITIPPFYEKNT